VEDDALRRKLDEQDWADLYARLVDYATHRCRSKTQGKDLAQSAIARVYAYDSKWDPEKEPLLLRYLMSVVNTLASNERTSAAAQRNVSMEKTHVRVRAERVRDESAISEARAVDGDLFARRLALLKNRIADDAQATRVLELALDGTETPAEIGAATGWTAKIVSAARLRMQRHAVRVAAELDVEGDDDMPSGEYEGDEDEEKSAQ
jgi:DNA-directed RNA polymerase specialized sigma24 family protein